MLARVGKYVKFALPKALAAQVPDTVTPGLAADTQGSKQVLLLQGCAQQVTTGQVNQGLQQLLGELDIGVLTAPREGCCGSLDLHLGDEAKTLRAARDNVDAIYPLLSQVDAVISTASGCGVTVMTKDATGCRFGLRPTRQTLPPPPWTSVNIWRA